LAERLPGITETARIFCGVDITKEPIPVLPTVHYNMGGIPTNYHGEVLSPTKDNPDRVAPGLMAIGEAACVSVHGANRLGTNSLLDIVVFGRAAAYRAAATVEAGSSHAPIPESATEKALDRFERMRHAKGDTHASEIRNAMQAAMQRHAAVFRSSASLTEGVEKMDQVASRMSDIGLRDRSLIWNTDLVEALELDNLMSQALITMRSAEQRQESRGAHAHEDFPERDDKEWMKHTVMWLNGDNASDLGYRPVHLNTLTNEVETVPPVARVY